MATSFAKQVIGSSEKLYAVIAQAVEHTIGNGEVNSANLFNGSPYPFRFDIRSQLRSLHYGNINRSYGII